MFPIYIIHIKQRIVVNGTVICNITLKDKKYFFLTLGFSWNFEIRTTALKKLKISLKDSLISKLWLNWSPTSDEIKCEK